MYVKAGFAYDPARDAYLCPKNLTTSTCARKTGAGRPHQNCPVRHRCTDGKERQITRWEYEHLDDAMRESLGREADPKNVRSCTVEHPFGTLKARVRHTQFLTRGLKNVRTETALNVLA